jgi:mRNA-degrading endonuclease toxin of MazEF toxin-antitoxin module
MPTRCAVTLDNLGEAWKAMLTEEVTTLAPRRMQDIYAALKVAVGC